MAQSESSPLVKLQRAIREGKSGEAAAIAYQLAEAKTLCAIFDKSMDLIELTVVVERGSVHVETITVKVLPSDSLLDLKDKVHLEYGYAISCQRWIINDKLVKIDDASLASIGICSGKRNEVFLHLIGIDKTAAATVKPDRSPELHRVKLKYAKKTEKVKPKGWVCGVCTYVNLPTRPGCEMCSSPPPANYKVPKNYKRSAVEEELLKKEQESEKALREAEEERKRLVQKEYESLVEAWNINLTKNFEPFECSICMDEVEKEKGITLSDCLHSFCLACIQETIKSCEDAAIKCPEIECVSFLLEREIKELVSIEIYQKYLQRSMTFAEGAIPNTFHCKTPDCIGWCIYEDNVNHFLCPTCAAPNCLTCRAIHGGKSCKQYQEELEILARTNEDAKKTKEAIEQLIANKEAMVCPGCEVVIMKKLGCDWICCTYCKKELCWVTKQARWGPKGNGDVSGGCRCRVGNVLCHPQCHSCH